METVKAFPAGYNEKGESLHLPGGLRCTTLAPESLIQKNSGRKHILKGNLRTFSDSGTTVYILRRHKDALFAWAEALDVEESKKTQVYSILMTGWME